MASLVRTSIFIDEYHPKADGKCRIKIKVTYNRQKKFYPTKYSMTLNEFNSMLGKKPRKELKDILLELQSIEKKAADVVDKLPVFTFKAFKDAFEEPRATSDSVFQAFDDYSKMLDDENRVGSSDAYKTAKNSLIAFCKADGIKGHITFPDIDVPFLKRYNNWMSAKGSSPTTVGIYLRALRCLFNIAIEEGKIDRKLYPFGKRRFEIPAGRNIKKALPLTDIGRIYNYKATPGSTTERMRDYWIFLYFSNGLNVKDFCRLRYKDIEEDFLVIKRAKTERTKKVSASLRIPLNDDTKAIIKKYGNKAIDKEAYIFPVLHPGVDAARERILVKQMTRLINDHMKKVAAELGIMTNLTTYVARHSFATVLKHSGASVEFISEALAHGDVKTTKSYLADLPDEHKKEVAKVLSGFKNVG